jgi:uncharacterized protein (DUF58 family)
MASAAPTPVVVLGPHRLYMLPTRVGLIFAAALLAMLLAAVNYNNSLAYMFTFILGAMVVVSMLDTHRNLAGLRITPGGCAPAFAGGEAGFGVWLHNESRRARHGIRVAMGQQEIVRLDLGPGESRQIVLPVPTRRRGELSIPAFTMVSQFPLGLLFTWARAIHLDHRCLVYPRPGPPRPLELAPDRRRYQDQGALPDGDDFAGLRTYQLGDPPRHVHWKAVARGRGMYTKQFGGAGQDTVWLDWDSLQGLDQEARLSQLCRWVLDADADGLRFGLRLPSASLGPGNGPQHRHLCLAALARF